ncbi:ATP-binding cassette domain-containing protein [Candidatus Deferrimicrobium sp.]|uniref:ATP-binding cassette domain-containing protein n=1 Tax=Candidatus Deferrimicrobium sp. TaxID=3060586 RepID=UPI002EDACC6E
MALLSLRDIRVAFGGPPLLEGASLQVEPGDRICLLGRNGTGKSTLLRVVNGEIAPDEGEIVRQQGVTVALVPQEVPPGLSGTVQEIVSGGPGMAAEKAISRLGLSPGADFGTLSGGMQRRVLIARALARESDLLLLDEPTNHLDIDGIAWLENFLLREARTLLFVTHDRMFLRKLATRIVELDRGTLRDWACDYETYLDRREADLTAESAQRARFDKRLAEEETWIRRGVKARGTRNEGRVRALERMREERRARRERVGTVRLEAQRAVPSGRLVVEALGVEVGYGDRPVVRDFSTTILRGDRVGVIGPNGSGKTTLLRVLLGELPPRTGSVRLGTRLTVAYSDQLREGLDEEKTVAENLGDGSDTVTVNGRSRHVIGYLQDVLFSPDRARSPVRVLSGGERNRLQLAKLFTKPFNLLVLDEPTNDLDIETLDLLEDLLLEYTGTLLLVSHDRAFLNNVVTSTLVISADGTVAEYAGGYDDWMMQRGEGVPPGIGTTSSPREIPRRKREGPRKLSFRERRELSELPGRIRDAEAGIATLEAERDELQRSMADPAFYRKDGARVAQGRARLEAVQTGIEEAYRRWESLEAALKDLEAIEAKPP